MSLKDKIKTPDKMVDQPDRDWETTICKSYYLGDYYD